MGHSGPDGKCKGVVTLEAQECQTIKTVAMQQGRVREQAEAQQSPSSASASASTAGDAWPQPATAMVLQSTNTHDSTGKVENSSSCRHTGTTTFTANQTAPMSDEVRLHLKQTIGVLCFV
jgi:hypothetical protein